jgi:hypothetical protein
VADAKVKITLETEAEDDAPTELSTDTSKKVVDAAIRRLATNVTRNLF